MGSTQRARKFKKVQAKKLVKSNKSNFFREIAFLAVLNFKNLFLAIFEIAKNGIWSKKFFVKLILFDFTSFFGWTFFNFLAYCDIFDAQKIE